MAIDPKIAMILKIVLTLANAIANGTLVFTGILSAQQAVTLVAVCQMLVTVLGVVMSAYSSSAPGPLAPPDSAAEKAAAAVVNLPAGTDPMAVRIAKEAAKATIDRATPTGAPK